jgi:hypothetical protein
MAHNIDNRQKRERRLHRAYTKSLRRLDAFDRKNVGKKDSPERFQIWLKGWRAKHPADARTPEQLTRVYKEEIAPPKPRPPKPPKVKKVKEPAEPKAAAQPKAEKKADKKTEKKPEKSDKKAKSE